MSLRLTKKIFLFNTVAKPSFVTAATFQYPYPSKEVQVKVPWGIIAVKQSGNKTNYPIICCHGYTDNAGSFDTLIPLLPDRFCYLALDYPGHGLSSHLPAGCFYTELVWYQSINYLLRHFGFKESGFLGHSMSSAFVSLYNILHRRFASFIIGIDMVSTATNPMERSMEQLSRRIDKVIDQDVKKRTPPLIPLDVLLNRTMKALAIDRNSAFILLRRNIEKVGNRYIITRDPKILNNELFRCQKEVILRRLEKSDNKICMIEYIEGLRLNDLKQTKETILSFASNSNKLMEYHQIPGNHLTHLTHPNRLSPIINDFLNKAAPPIST